jgi:hypothetical protein
LVQLQSAANLLCLKQAHYFLFDQNLCAA